MYSCDTEKEARTLVIMACPKSLDGDYVARELIDHNGEPRTGDDRVDGFVRFGLKLAEVHSRMKKEAK